MAPAIIDGGLPTSGLLATVALAKYLDHLPLYRLEQRAERQGVMLSRRTMSTWIGQLGVALSAINHPVGHATQALINLWFKQNPNDNDLLPAELTPIFTTLCDVQVDRFRHGRVLMGSRLIAFFRVDRPWTEQNLLPLFDWSRPDEAKAV